MKRSELGKYLIENNLLEDVREKSGIYAITIDNCVVYIGQSKNIRERCKTHIYNTQNAMLIKEQKYLLLLSAQLGGHRVDCVNMEYCDESVLRERENSYIKTLKPMLNIMTPDGKQDISNLKVEDILNEIALWRKPLESID